MATELPAKRIPTASQDYEIVYDGKASFTEIYNGKTAQLKSILNIGNDPVNRLIYGDNLTVMRSLLNDSEIVGKVKLIYIDPPFATGTSFSSRKQAHAYSDLLDGAAYLEFIRQRLILMRELLADDGSIYVHLDSKMAFPVKVIMDEIFGAKNFRNWITRKKCNPKNYTRNQYGNIADYIMFYTKTDKYIWNRPYDPWSEEAMKKEYPYIEKETGRRYKRVPIHAPGIRNGETGKEWRGMKPPKGKHWQYTPDKLDEMDANGEIYWSATGNPRRKVYFDNSPGIPVQDIWMEFLDAYNQNVRITGYPTEKNPDMISRIIKASSREGDIVLDCFSGSGTTAAVAEENGRKWIAVDNSLLAIETTLKRLAKGTKPMGDFVNKNKSQAELFPGTVLKTGFKLLIDDGDEELEPISSEDIKRWEELFLNLTF